jgi:hypothetical protein
MAEAEEILNPSKKLANLLVSKLIDENLLISTKKEEVRKKLISGTASIDDWTLWAEISCQKTEKVQKEENS